MVVLLFTYLIPAGIRTLLLTPLCVNITRVSDPSRARSYRGVAADDRIAARREALIDAALEVFTAAGSIAPSVSVDTAAPLK